MFNQKISGVNPYLVARMQRRRGERRSSHHFTTSPRSNFDSHLLPVSVSVSVSAFVSNTTRPDSSDTLPLVHVVRRTCFPLLREILPKILSNRSTDVNRPSTTTSNSQCTHRRFRVRSRIDKASTPRRSPSTRHATRLRMKHRSHKQSARISKHRGRYPPRERRSQTRP